MNTYRILVEKAHWRRTLEKRRSRWKENNITHPTEIREAG
jgi:hypothetical protein